MKTLGAFLFLLGLSLSVHAQDQQLGARTKAMGGSYTAFEDDPVSIWLNPAGIATQPDQLSIAYQTYTAYPVTQKRGFGDEIITSVEPDTILVDPAIIPSYLGMVFQLGDADAPMAVGVCFARPYHLKYALDRVEDPNQAVFVAEDNVEQSLSRFRISLARDFRMKDVGEPGWFTHLAVGVGIDVGFESWEFTSTTGQDSSDTSTGFGGGAGLLLGLYDDTESFKINLGIAYQSAIKYEFNIDPDILPAFDMPQQLNVGATLYLLEGTPLRVTIDFQWIDWSETAEDPFFLDQPKFQDALNYSVGMEYRIPLDEEGEMFIFPRLGYRRFDAPWDDKDDLPMTGGFKLVLDTKGDVFNIVTFGVGISWTTESGALRSIDLAGDVGGDSINAAVGFNMEL